jgi:hypothetical protein
MPSRPGAQLGGGSPASPVQADTEPPLDPLPPLDPEPPFDPDPPLDPELLLDPRPPPVLPPLPLPELSKRSRLDRPPHPTAEAQPPMQVTTATKATMLVVRLIADAQ